MMGLMVLVFFAIYFAISLWVIFAVLEWAASNKRSGWWGVLAAFAMYNLVFWDLIPTLVMHKYYCDTQAGFWVYKTPEQWKKENPELTAEDLKTDGEKANWNKFKWQFPYKKINSNSERYEYMINTRLYIADSLFENVSQVLPITKRTYYIEDIKDNKKLAKNVDFSSGYGNPMTNGGIRGFKTWLSNTSCENGVGNQTLEHIHFVEKIISLGESK